MSLLRFAFQRRDFESALDNGSGSALSASVTGGTLLAAVASAFLSFGIQFALFLVLRWRLTRIYRPKTYMVSEAERVPVPSSGPYQWVIPVFTMSNSTVINKCGLDAYFFLRYLRMLLKIFVPMAVVILPILLPINSTSGPPPDPKKAQGLNYLGWQNIGLAHQSRLWAHLILAICVILWVCFVIYQELRGYIRIRQAYLTSPQHRIRASATTVLVRGIPRKWLSVEALESLYDVFPGGIRNIWINRDFDELLNKVDLRNKVAKKLESAETSLIRLCNKKHRKAEAEKAKKEGKKMSKQEKKDDEDRQNEDARRVAEGPGQSSGDPNGDKISAPGSGSDSGNSPRNPIRLVGQGIGALGQGLSTFGQKSKGVAGNVTDGVTTGVLRTNAAINIANRGIGFVSEDEADLQHQREATRAERLLQELHGPDLDDTADPHTGLQLGPRRGTFKDSQHDSDAVLPTNNNLERSAQGSLSENRVSAQQFDGSFDELQPQRTNAEESKDEDQSQGGVIGLLTRTATIVTSKIKEPAIAFPSPQPRLEGAEEYPLGEVRPTRTNTVNTQDTRMASSKWAEAVNTVLMRKSTQAQEEKPDYQNALNEDYDDDKDGEAEWMKYIKAKDRDTIRLPLAGWMPALPFVGKKVDKIYHLRRELARLNAEIEFDQEDADRFPLMNSAFIQFNHQVAAHMACQSVSHHIPHTMAPRIVEIAPNQVIWSNMSIKWWESYIRMFIAVAFSIALIVLYAIPVSFTGALSQVSSLAAKYHWLAWLAKLPKVAISVIQGVLPPLLLNILLSLVPVIFRLLVKQQGVPTANDSELGVQQFYFIFLFIQVFLVVSVSTGLTKLFSQAYTSPTQVVVTISEDLPAASGYFFNYMIVNALSNSSGALLQVGTLIFWFILGPILDSTARQKWRRQTNLQNVQWGSYFPPFTNFAVIGLIFSIIAPLILVFNLITFALYWIVQRYNVIYVYTFRGADTGGLLFPAAVDQLFAGLYIMELCLCGLFFLARNADDKASCLPQGIIMIVALVATLVFQLLLNSGFKPLLRYLPITLEDDAVIRDEEFARAQEAKWRGQAPEADVRESEDIEDRLEEKQRQEEEEERAAKQAEKDRIRQHRDSRSRGPSRSESRQGHSAAQPDSKGHSWKQSAWKSAAAAGKLPGDTLRRFAQPRGRNAEPTTTTATDPNLTENGYSIQHIKSRTTAAYRAREDRRQREVEAQRAAGDVLFEGFSDELEDLTPEERDTLVRYSFQHAALRARRPVIWIPRDPLGVSDDEIARSKLVSTVMVPDMEGTTENEKGSTRTYIWISNDGAALDAKGHVVFRKSPPDFASVDLIEL